MGNRGNLKLVALCALFLFAAGGAPGSDNVAVADPGSQVETDISGKCLAKHYPAFKGGQAVWGFMPGSVEQEAICRIEFDPADSQQAKEEIGGDEKSAVTLELRKLWIMDRMQRLKGDGVAGSVSVFSRNLVKNPPGKYLGIKPGAKPEQAGQMDTSGVRERVPDLLRTLDAGKAPKIYYFHRIDERLPGLCMEQKEDGSCGRIVSKKKSEEQVKKTLNGEEEGGFKGFMKKVKNSFTGPPPKEVSEWKLLDFYGVKISEVAYSFDYDFAYIGFFARIAEREPFAGKESPQYTRDVYRDLIRQFGEPALKLKGAADKPGATASHGIWITGDGFRIDALCINPADNSGLCRDGRIAVRRLPPPYHSPPAEGAGFFD
jgi:hypothetical protein